MFPLPRPSSPRHRSASCSTDDHSSAKDGQPKLFQRHYAHDLSFSSQSLATSNSHHDDPPTPSMLTHASHTTSARSTPMTSPSTAYSNLFPGSISSATSESAPSAESNYRSEFGMLMPGSSSPHSPIHGSAPSRSFHPFSSRSRSTTESDPQISDPQTPHKPYFAQLTDRPLTAPTDYPPAPATSSTADSSPADHHTRSQSRLTVSIKNLFSRQALPSPRFSFNSATTAPPDTEASSCSFHVPAAPGKWPMTPHKSRPPDPEISGSAAPVIPSPGHGSDTALDAHRRYASEAVAKTYNARTGNGLPTSQESPDGSFRNVPPTRGKDFKTRNVLRRRPSGSAKLFRTRERGMSSPSPRQDEGDADLLHLQPEHGRSRQGGVPIPLTPAGAVVEAYKQHELYRDDVSTPPKPSLGDRMSSTTSHDGGDVRDRSEYSPTPYYTVSGSLSERRVRAGGPDDRWVGFESYHHTFTSSQVTSSHQPSISDPGGRSFTRKLSSRWRKVEGGGMAPEESSSRDRGHSKGRPSLQEVGGAGRSTLRLTGQSIDDTQNGWDGALASPAASHARSESKGDKSEGPMLWRLMRRISTGGLRDRFQSDKAVPPVPAIPKELLKKTNQDECNYYPVSASRHQAPSSLHAKDHSRTFTAPRNIAVARPSITASSSSPNSSDVASAQFFKTHSTRSSISSYGEAVAARAAEPILDRHIIAPREQLRLADDHVESDEPCLPMSRFPYRLVSVPTGLKTAEDGKGDQVPLPSPSRQTGSGELPSSGSSRPCSTSASVSGSARGSFQVPGAGPAPSRMVDGIVSLSPPPRAAKNLPRGGGSATSSPPHPTVAKQVDDVVGLGIAGARQMDRTPSSRSDMTARFESPKPGRSQVRDQAALAPTRRQFSFRELDMPRRPPLSEQEKTDIWNDLLARSDRAGGTLHINSGAELLSDNMRLSTYSEA